MTNTTMSHTYLNKELEEEKWEGDLQEETILWEVRGKIGGKGAIGI